MTNVETKIEGSKLIITIDLDKAPMTLSPSGKTRQVASTQGNVKLHGSKLPGLTVGLNVYVPAN